MKKFIITITAIIVCAFNAHAQKIFETSSLGVMSHFSIGDYKFETKTMIWKRTRRAEVSLSYFDMGSEQQTFIKINGLYSEGYTAVKEGVKYEIEDIMKFEYRGDEDECIALYNFIVEHRKDFEEKWGNYIVSIGRDESSVKVIVLTKQEMASIIKQIKEKEQKEKEAEQAKQDRINGLENIF